MTTPPIAPTHPPEKRHDSYGRGSAVGYTGAYVEPGTSTVELEDVVERQNARGPQ
jgi:hypothetical protein